MTCEQGRELLSVYLDGEVAGADRQALEAHLEECSACRTRLHAMRALKHAIARLPSREAPPGAVRARIEAIRFGRHRTVVERIVTWIVIAATVVLAALGGWYVVARFTRRSLVADELVADHLRSTPDAMPAEVASNDPQAVVRFFDGRVAFRPVAPAIPGSRLVGGRLCRLEGEASQLLFYEINGQTLSLFVSRAPLVPDACEAARGHSVCGRMVGRITLALVGKLPRETLQRLLAAAVL